LINPVNDEASQLSYAVGIRAFAPFLRRMFALEALVGRQVEQITALQTTVLRLKYPNVQVVNSKVVANG
jgi:hypothetical protein